MLLSYSNSFCRSQTPTKVSTTPSLSSSFTSPVQISIERSSEALFPWRPKKLRLLGEVYEGSIGQGGLRFKVQKIQGMPLYAFPIFQKSCSWRQFETDLKLDYRDLIQIGGFDSS